MKTHPPITIHMIANAHLDPVWLWPWQSGLDEVIATCRTMCDLLDDYPDAIFTAGEAWRYWQLSQVDPQTFERVRAHVRAGRWALVNGWWIQPDCNFPSGFAMQKQIELGREFFLEQFGQFPEMGYNVDSFGHAASLPKIMRDAGQKYYVMMRPQAHEMKLPAPLFRWRGYEGGPEVITFRVVSSYASWAATPSEEFLRQTTNDLPAGVGHTMCFYGVGDHGGGPTAQMLQWIRDHANAFDGLKLEFSSPAKFFAAVAPHVEKLPLVTGELQFHAMGCYSVVRSIKTRVRRAEHLLSMAENIAKPEEKTAIRDAWRHVAFNHFHDILGGTSIPSADAQQCEQLGGAITVGETILLQTLRRKAVALPADPLQRIVLWNPSDSLFEGYVEHEPWLGASFTRTAATWTKGGKLLDETGQAIPYQVIQNESVNDGGMGALNFLRVVFRTRLEPGQVRVVRLDPTPAAPVPTKLTASLSAITNELGFGVDLGKAENISLGHNCKLALPRIDLLDDPTDNWSHGTDRFAEAPVTSPVWDAPALIDSGPVMASLLRTGRVGDTTLLQEWRVSIAEQMVELRLRIHFHEKRRILKLVLPVESAQPDRVDGISGGHLLRQNTGRECPLRDWTRLTTAAGHVAIISPHLYAVDVTQQRARFTLLRSPILTQHDPSPFHAGRAVYADQGEHEFRIRFTAAQILSPEGLDQQALMLHRPVLCADLTRGMPRHGAVSK